MSAGIQSFRKADVYMRKPEPLDGMTSDFEPISLSERKERIAKAQRLLLQNKMEALVLESGTSLEYFTGISWWPSERTMVAVIPAIGEIFYICPGFEEARLRELILVGKKVYIWQEDESPYGQIALAFHEAGMSGCRDHTAI